MRKRCLKKASLNPSGIRFQNRKERGIGLDAGIHQRNLYRNKWKRLSGQKAEYRYQHRVPIIDKGIFGQSRAVSASCCVAFHSAYVQYASFKRLAGRRNGLCLTL